MIIKSRPPDTGFWCYNTNLLCVLMDQAPLNRDIYTDNTNECLCIHKVRRWVTWTCHCLFLSSSVCLWCLHNQLNLREITLYLTNQAVRERGVKHGPIIPRSFYSWKLTCGQVIERNWPEVRCKPTYLYPVTRWSIGCDWDGHWA